MKRWERVCCAVKHRETGRVPLGELVVEDEFVREYTGADRIDEAARARCFLELGLDAVCLQKAEDIKFLSRETDLFLFALVGGGFSAFLEEYSFQEAMVLIGRQPARAGRIISDRLRQSLPLARNLVDSGARGVMIADDLAFNRGPYVSPEFMREHLFPSLAAAVSTLKAWGVPVFFHSDGNLTALLNDLVKTGFDGLQCLEKGAGMDLSELKRTYGSKLCFMGGVDVELLSGETDGELIRGAVAGALREGAPGGGYIFGTNSGLFSGLNQDSVNLLYRTARSG